MKKIILSILILVSGSLKSQTISSAELTEYGKPIVMTNKAGSCGSPDGPMNPIGGPPGSYAWLQANGYCNPAAYGNNATVCWTFTPTSSSVTMNSGYSQTGCANVSFGSFNLYSATCTLLGSGLSFTGLTPGIQYTWCMSGSTWGGGPGCIGFTDFCPYYTNNVVLPITLDYFNAELVKDGTYVSWASYTEINNDYYTIEKSRDAKQWEIINTTLGVGNSSIRTEYNFTDHETNEPGTTYYRLSQTDFDGATEYFKIVSISIKHPQEKPIAYDTVGRVIPDPTTYIGIIIFKYKNGFWYKVTRVQ